MVINSPLGLEQGFTLEQRPEGQGELQLALSVTGDLVPTLDRNELAFADQTGATRLRYGALAAFDAEGRALPARMCLDGERLVLAVDDAGACYPVVVHPLFSVAFAIVDSGTLGTVEITDKVTGAFTYTPVAGASGTDSFTFRVSDGLADSNTATVTVTIRSEPAPAPGCDSGDGGDSGTGGKSKKGGGGALSPLMLLLGLAAVARRWAARGRGDEAGRFVIGA